MAEVEGDVKKVALAIDGSAQAEAACDFYLDNYCRGNVEVVLLHCLEVPYLPYDVRKDVLDNILDKCRKDGKEVEDKFTAKLSNKGVKCKLISDFGKPGEFIVKKSSEEGATMVVMGTRGLGKIRRTIMGSVSDYVLHHAHCPVLIFKH